MGRPAKGAVRWNPRTNVWEVRVTLLDGTRSKPIAMTDLPPCSVVPTSPPDECSCVPCMFATDSGKHMKRRITQPGTHGPASSRGRNLSTVRPCFGQTGMR